MYTFVFFFSSRRRHTRYWRDWSSDVCSSDLRTVVEGQGDHAFLRASVPEHGSVEPRSGREPLVDHEPTGRQPDPGRGQGRHGAYRTTGGCPEPRQGGAAGGDTRDGLPGMGPRVPHYNPPRISSAAALAECGRWAERADWTIRRRWSG